MASAARTMGDPVDASDSEVYPPLRTSIVAFTFLLIAEFFYSWSWNTVDVLRPYIRESLGLTLTEAGSGYSAQSAGALIGAVVIGQLGDRLGRRRMLVTVMIGYGLSAIAGAFVHQYWQYLVERLTLGLFLGGIFPIVVGTYVSLFEGHVRGRLASFVTAVASGAIVVLGLASSAFAEDNWRLLLWIGGTPPIILSALAFVLIPRIVDDRRKSVAGQRLPIVELFAPGLRAQTLKLAALMGLNFFAYQAYSGWLTTYLRDVRGLGASPVGQLVAWQFAANIVGCFFWGWAGDRWGRRIPAFGFLFAAISIAAYLMVPTIYVLLGAIGAVYGFMLSSSVIWGPWLTELYPPHLKSTAASIFNWGRMISFFAPLITGQLAASFGLSATMGVGSATFLLAGILWLSLPETHAAPLLTGLRRSKPAVA